MKKFSLFIPLLLIFTNLSPAKTRPEITFLSGSIADFTQNSYFNSLEYSQGNISAGIFRRGSDTLVFGKLLYSFNEFFFQAGHLEHDENEGLLLSNGGRWPGFDSFPFKRPLGADTRISWGKIAASFASYTHTDKSRLSIGRLMLAPVDELRLHIGAYAISSEKNESTPSGPAAHGRLEYVLSALGKWKYWFEWNYNLHETGTSLRNGITGLKWFHHKNSFSLQYHRVNTLEPLASGIYESFPEAITTSLRWQVMPEFQFQNRFRYTRESMRSYSFLELGQIVVYHRHIQHRGEFAGFGYSGLPDSISPIFSVYSDGRGYLAAAGISRLPFIKLGVFASHKLAAFSPADPIFYRGNTFPGMNEDRVFSLPDDIGGIQSIIAAGNFSMFGMAGSYLKMNFGEKWLISFRIKYSRVF